MPLNEETTCVQNYFKDNNIVQKYYCKTLFIMRNAFKRICEVLATATVFGCSSITCRAIFSTLNRIVTPHRQMMLFGHASSLTIISFKKKHLEIINADAERF